MKAKRASVKTMKKAVSSPDEKLTKTVKEKALALGAHLVGIAPMERLEGAPPELHPKRLLPDTAAYRPAGRPTSR